MANIVAHCPKCGGTQIREKNVAYAELRVTAWELGEYGDLMPSDYDTDEDADWETGSDPAPYVCRRCRWEGDCAALLVEHEPDDED